MVDAGAAVEHAGSSRAAPREVWAPPRRAGWLPESLVGLGVVATVVVVALLSTQGLAVSDLVGELLWALAGACALVAAIVVRVRRPDHPLGPWFVAMVVPGPVTNALDVLLRRLISDGAPGGVIAAVTVTSGLMGLAGTVAALHVLSRLPDGRVDWRIHVGVLRVAWLVLPAYLLLVVTVPTVLVPWYVDAAPVPNPLQVAVFATSVDTAHTVVGLLQAAPLLAAIVLLGLRYRRLGAPLRRAIRWLLVPLVVVLTGSTLNVLLRDTEQVLIAVLFLLLQPMLAAAIALAIIAPARLDADRVLRRSLVHGLLWLAIAGVYVAVGAAVGVTAGRRFPTEWAVVLTVLATLVVQPARRALERMADRWVFGSRSDPARVVAHLGATLADTFDLQELLPRMAATLEEGLGLQWARVRLDGASTSSEEAGTDLALAVPVRLGTDHVGMVECGPRRGGVPLTDDDRAVVETLARQAALAVHNVRLTRELRVQADELAASRARLVRAQESERRRIERNIHDGVQQDLVALIGQAGLARRSAEVVDGGLQAELGHLQAGLRRLLGDLRELAAGIHPSLLSDRGLLAAVEALAARHPVPVSLLADPSLRALRLPPEVEGAGYFTVAEALANSLKHAAATGVEVRLVRTNGSLHVIVDDDGVGFVPVPPAAAGQGLANLAERVAALGGHLDVASAPGEGTTVTATLRVEAAVVP